MTQSTTHTENAAKRVKGGRTNIELALALACCYCHCSWASAHCLLYFVFRISDFVPSAAIKMLLKYKLCQYKFENERERSNKQKKGQDQRGWKTGSLKQLKTINFMEFNIIFNRYNLYLLQILRNLKKFSIKGL